MKIIEKIGKEINEMFKEYYLSFKVGYTYSTVKKNRKFSVIK